MKLNFKSGFVLGFVVALIIVPLEIMLGSSVKSVIEHKRGYGSLCVRENAQAVSAGIPEITKRYHLTDLNGTNVYAPIYSDVAKNTHTYTAEDIIMKNGFRYYNLALDALSSDDSDYITSKKSLAGIDVSRYQSNIDWTKVKQSGVDYAILRVGYRGYGTEGKIVLDENFDSHATGALSAGIPIGVYFFSEATTIKEAEEEADTVIAAISKYNITYPVVFDTEHIPNTNARANDLSVSELTSITKAFCKKIEKAGYEPMIYANERWLLLHLDLRELTDYPIWLASYRENLTFPYEVEMWQYTESGSVDGIDGNVDLNVYLGE